MMLIVQLSLFLVTVEIAKTFEIISSTKIFQPLRLTTNKNENSNDNTKVRPSKKLRNTILDKDLFSKASITQFEVDEIITSELPTLRGRDVVTFMSLSSKLSKRNRNIDILQRHLCLIVKCLKRLPTTGVRARDIAGMIHSLQRVQESDSGAKDFLTLMKVMMDDSSNGSPEQTIYFTRAVNDIIWTAK
jgi:hypothetical protein